MAMKVINIRTALRALLVTFYLGKGSLRALQLSCECSAGLQPSWLAGCRLAGWLAGCWLAGCPIRLVPQNTKNKIRATESQQYA